MAPPAGIILCLAYILGLLTTALPWRFFGFPLGGLAILGLGLVAARFLPQRRTGLQAQWWIMAGLIAVLASIYWQLRLPTPAATDISRAIAAADSPPQEQVVTVQGKVASFPKVTRSQRVQFWLTVTQLEEITGANQPAKGNRAVTGQLYVTVPLLQATGLNSGQPVAVTGTLYKPKPANNPGGFDFQAYLAQQGGFAGLRGTQVTLPNQEPSRWGWWAVRQRILRAQVRWLGSPEGPLVSAMVLGSRAVDLPYDLRDRFAQIGLAHALAASGFQTSLILGVVLSLTRSFSPRIQFGFGLLSLLTFLGLTGLQPSVLRAVLMGTGALVALVMQRKTRPLGSLLVAATLILLFNPLWIWDLGLQLSLLATLGLLVTVPPLLRRLDWLPPTIATVIAVPIAATVWTLPLQIYAFGLFSPYSLLANVLTTPLISILSLGGVISALVALIWPWLGGFLSWGLYYPAYALIGIVEGFARLPGSTLAVGTISLMQLWGLYGLILLVWLKPIWQKRWLLVILGGIGLLLLPGWYSQFTTYQATILSTSDEPVLVLQNRGRVLLINSGAETTATLTVLPFLQKQGVNRIEWAIATEAATDFGRGWHQIVRQLPIQQFYVNDSRPPAISQSTTSTTEPSPLATPSPTANATAASTIVETIPKVPVKAYQALPNNQPFTIGSIPMRLVSPEPGVLEFQLQQQTWLLLNGLKLAQQNSLVAAKRLHPVQVLWWAGEPLTPELLQVIQPKVAIASAPSLDPDTLNLLKQRQVQLYWTGRDGAVVWNPRQGFQKTLDTAATIESSF